MLSSVQSARAGLKLAGSKRYNRRGSGCPVAAGTAEPGVNAELSDRMTEPIAQ